VPFPLHDSGETARNAVMVAHMETPVPDLMELRKKNLPTGWPKQKRDLEMRVPQWLLTLISTCLEKDPEKRYPSGMALQEALFEGSLSTEQPAVSVDELPDNTVVGQPARAAYYDRDKMHISKPLFFALMGMFAISLVTCGYLFLNQNNPKVPVKAIAADTTKKAPDTPKQAVAHDYHLKEKANDSAAQQAVNDVINDEKQKAESQKKADSTGTPQDTSTVKQPDNNQ
jgi:eukaryotic-like serine/threonine-protein kinase